MSSEKKIRNQSESEYQSSRIPESWTTRNLGASKSAVRTKQEGTILLSYHRVCFVLKVQMFSSISSSSFPFNKDAFMTHASLPRTRSDVMSPQYTVRKITHPFLLLSLLLLLSVFIMRRTRPSGPQNTLASMRTHLLLPCHALSLPLAL